MAYFRLVSAMLLVIAAELHGQCNPHPLSPSMLPPCPSIADRLAEAGMAARDFNNKVADLNAAIDTARRNYWKVFPNGPGYEAAEKAFLGALWNKDMYYMMFAIQTGMTGDAAKMPNAIGAMGGDPSIKDLNHFPTNVDHGVRPFAFPLFANWVSALRRAEGREKDGTFASPVLLATAVTDKSNWRKAYEDARDWAEFTSSGLDISKYANGKVYLIRQMEADVCLAMEASKPADLPSPTASTLELYNLFVKMFGEKEVLAAADATLHAPKNSMGGLAPRADVEIGTYFATTPNPYLLFLSRATQSSPRAFAISLAFDQYALIGGQANTSLFDKERWAKALSIFDQLGAKYGNANVLAAADRVLRAPKDPLHGIRGDTSTNGLVYWFDTLIKNPKAEVPDGQVPHFKVSSYDDRWLGKTAEVRGTVSRVDVAKGQFPPWATIHFKESANDSFTGFSPNSEMLQEKYGENFAGLTGRQVDILGEINQWKQGGGVRILDLSQIKILDAAAAGADFRESKPVWLTMPKPVEVLVDSPKYLGWKAFSPGTTAVYETRLLFEHAPGTDQYTRNKISEITFRLDSINDKRAIVTASSTVWHMNGAPPTQSAPNQLIYQAKEPPTPPDSSRVVTTGEETLAINGKKIATRWESIARANDPMTFTKTWRSDEVPGGLVLSHDQSHREITGKTYRSISETIYAPFPGVAPELTDKSPGTPASAARPEPPSGPRPAPQASSPTGKGSAASPPAARPATSAPPEAPATSIPPVRAPYITRGRPAVQAVSPSGQNQQAVLAQRYSALIGRYARARAGLNQYQRSQPGTELPADVRDAAGRLDTQVRSVATAMRMRDYAQTDQNMQALEETLGVVEKFLEK